MAEKLKMCQEKPHLFFNEASPEQAPGYHREGRWSVRHHGFSRSSLCKVTSEQAPRNLLIHLLRFLAFSDFSAYRRHHAVSTSYFGEGIANHDIISETEHLGEFWKRSEFIPIKPSVARA